MSTETFYVKLEGKSQLHEPKIMLEDFIINIWSRDHGITWDNKKVDVNIEGDLQIYLSCKAVSGTGWTFTVKNKNSNKIIYEEEGETGEALESRKGKCIENFSERKVTKPAR